MTANSVLVFTLTQLMTLMQLIFKRQPIEFQMPAHFEVRYGSHNAKRPISIRLLGNQFGSTVHAVAQMLGLDKQTIESLADKPVAGILFAPGLVWNLVC
jgi:hypothetical protein